MNITAQALLMDFRNIHDRNVGNKTHQELRFLDISAKLVRVLNNSNNRNIIKRKY